MVDDEKLLKLIYVICPELDDVPPFFLNILTHFLSLQRNNVDLSCQFLLKPHCRCNLLRFFLNTLWLMKRKTKSKMHLLMKWWFFADQALDSGLLNFKTNLRRKLLLGSLWLTLQCKVLKASGNMQPNWTSKLLRRILISYPYTVGCWTTIIVNACTCCCWTSLLPRLYFCCGLTSFLLQNYQLVLLIYWMYIFKAFVGDKVEFLSNYFRLAHLLMLLVDDLIQSLDSQKYFYEFLRIFS